MKARVKKSANVYISAKGVYLLLCLRVRVPWVYIEGGGCPKSLLMTRPHNGDEVATDGDSCMNINIYTPNNKGGICCVKRHRFDHMVSSSFPLISKHCWGHNSQPYYESFTDRELWILKPAHEI